MAKWFISVALIMWCSASSAGLLGTGPGNSESATPLPSLKVLKSTATTDVSDLWWNPSESGWGMQLVQNNGFVFATLFVYGADGKPTWFTAPLNYTGSFVWSGPLYANTGPWYAGPFNPSQVGVRQAGVLTFQLASIGNGTVVYTVDGVQVTKNVTRETMVNENITGVYDAVGTQTQSCSYPLTSGTFSALATLSISQSGNAVTGQVLSPSGSCTLTGTYGQSGKLGAVTGTYSCTWGEIGTLQIFEIVTTEYGMLVRISEQSNLCSSITGEFAGNRR